MIKLFTLKILSRSSYLNKKKQAAGTALQEAPGDRVKFIKDFARAYEVAELTTCKEKDLILN